MTKTKNNVHLFRDDVFGLIEHEISGRKPNIDIRQHKSFEGDNITRVDITVDPSQAQDINKLFEIRQKFATLVNSYPDIPAPELMFRVRNEGSAEKRRERLEKEIQHLRDLVLKLPA